MSAPSAQAPTAGKQTQGANAAMMMTNSQFLRAAKPKTQRVATNAPYTDGQTQAWNLPQAGLLEALWFRVAGTIVVAGTVTSGTFQTYPAPAPFSIIRRMRLGSNQSFNLRDISGWSWYKWVRYRTGIDFLSNQSVVKYSTSSLGTLGTTVTNPIVNGANVVAQTYNLAITLPIPVAYNRAAQQGLILLQINTLIYSVQIDWGRITGGIGATGGTNDLFTSLVGTGLSITATLGSWLAIDYFEPPATGNYSNLIYMFMSVFDQVYPSIVAGVNTLIPPTADFYTLILTEWVNNAAPITPGNLQTIQWQYAGNIYDYLDDNEIKVSRSMYFHDIPPMDGVIDWDLGLRRMEIGQRDTYDAFNDLAVTDLKFNVTIPSSVTITQPAQVTGTYEALRLSRQVGM